MTRFHVHMAVDDLATAIQFFSGLFGKEPTRREHDYAKWQLDEPRVNFALSARGKPAGIEHLGIEAETPAELAELTGRLAQLDGRRHEEKRTTCCYAVSDKTWIVDPAGTPWEVFHTMARAASFGASGPDLAARRQMLEQLPSEQPKKGGGCCG